LLEQGPGRRSPCGKEQGPGRARDCSLGEIKGDRHLFRHTGTFFGTLFTVKVPVPFDFPFDFPAGGALNLVDQGLRIAEGAHRFDLGEMMQAVAAGAVLKAAQGAQGDSLRKGVRGARLRKK
jgi:hypothetical protein